MLSYEKLTVKVQKLESKMLAITAKDQIISDLIIKHKSLEQRLAYYENSNSPSSANSYGRHKKVKPKNTSHQYQDMLIKYLESRIRSKV